MGFSSVSFHLLVFLLGITIVYCGNHCVQKCKFNKKCRTTSYVQLTPCTYSCTCDGVVTYYVEDSFTTCGTGKKCYQGDCLIEVPKKCQCRYGNHYIGLLNPNNPCVYYCYSRISPCIQYEENYPNGASCYTFNHKRGQCLRGRCACGELTSHVGKAAFDDSKVEEHEFATITSSAANTATVTSGNSGVRQAAFSGAESNSFSESGAGSISDSRGSSNAAAATRDSYLNTQSTQAGSGARAGSSGAAAESNAFSESAAGSFSASGSNTYSNTATGGNAQYVSAESGARSSNSGVRGAAYTAAESGSFTGSASGSRAYSAGGSLSNTYSGAAASASNSISNSQSLTTGSRASSNSYSVGGAISESGSRSVSAGGASLSAGGSSASVASSSSSVQGGQYSESAAEAGSFDAESERGPNFWGTQRLSSLD